MLALGSGLFAAPRAADASCGDFGGIGVFLVTSVGAGSLVTGLYVVADLASGCGISSELDDATFVVVPSAALGASVLTAILLWLYADEAEAPPFALGVWPREGGASLQLGFRF